MYLPHEHHEKSLKCLLRQTVLHLSHSLIVKAGEPKERPLDMARPISPLEHDTNQRPANVPQPIQISNVSNLGDSRSHFAVVLKPVSLKEVARGLGVSLQLPRLLREASTTHSP